MESLPQAMLVHILLHVDLKSLLCLPAVCSLWRSAFADPELAELFELLGVGHELQAMSASLLQTFPGLVAVHLPTRGAKSLFALRWMLDCIRNMHKPASKQLQCRCCGFATLAPSSNAYMIEHYNEQSGRERSLWQATEANAAHAASNYTVYPAGGFDIRRQRYTYDDRTLAVRSLKQSVEQTGFLFCSACGFCLKHCWRREYLTAGDVMIPHGNREPWVVEHKTYSRPGKGGKSKVSIELRSLFLPRRKRNAMINIAEEATQCVAWVCERCYDVCDVDNDGFVALLDQETGACRADLRISELEQQSISDAATMSEVIDALQEALASDELVAVVGTVRAAAPLNSTESMDMIEQQNDVHKYLEEREEIMSIELK